MAAMNFPLDTRVDNRRVAPTMDRFLDRRGVRWNIGSISTVPMLSGREEDIVSFEHMRLRPTSVGEVVLAVEFGGPLEFRAGAGQFDFQPDDE